VVPWERLEKNLGEGRPGALCVACTEVNTGRVVVFIDGPLCDTSAWVRDPNAHAICTRIQSQHVRASAAIPFVFPAVKIGDLHYLDGGLRANTPLSPVLRLRANRVLVVALRCRPGLRTASGPIDTEAITQPSFLLGKLLDILTMDQLEQELRQLDVLNTLLSGVEGAVGGGCVERVNEAVTAKRGVPYRQVETFVLRPSEDIGHIAADCYRHSNVSWSTNVIARMMTRTLVRGTPREEADLLSYLYFDSEFTNALIELGRTDAKNNEEQIYRLLAGSPASPSESSPTRREDLPCD
jgi:NTE family protein